MIQEISLKNRSFRPFPEYSDRNAWSSLPEAVKSNFLEAAQKMKGRQWPSLPASLYLDFYRDGNRSRYEGLYFGRRSDLLVLVLAECIAGKGEYLDDIINGIWLICEETTWVVPAHLNHGRPSPGSFYYRPGSAEKTPYPEPRRLHEPEDDIYIDLFAAETGSLLAWVYYFLGDVIAGLVPEVKRRMEEEVIRRILVPFTEQDFFSWMGLCHDNPVNNWNPWINSNVLAAFLVFAPVFPRAEQGVNKAIKSVNRFIHFYTDDGGCDEGPNYFGVAGASLLDFIEELGIVADVSPLYREPKIRNMASYIYKVYIGGDYYVNYADAPPRVYLSSGVLERAGKNTGDNALVDFVSYLRAHNWCRPDMATNNAFNVFRYLSGVLASPKPRGEVSPKVPALVWFPGIQVLTARGEANFGGFFFSAKGGHNSESHNHNDVGSFILFYDGTPVLVDAGVETYTKFTFSAKRYDLWAMQSGYHNLPTLNGVDQAPGKEYCARDVALCGLNGEAIRADNPDSGVKFSLDIAGAYPASAGIKSYKREFVYRPDSGLEINDSYSFEKSVKPLILNLLCYEKPEIAAGRAVLSGKVAMDFDSGLFIPEIEEIKLTDPKINSDWQKDYLYRLRLVRKEADLSGMAALRFTKKR